MNRVVPVCVARFGVLVEARPAQADTGMLPNGAQLTYDKLYIFGGNNFGEPADPDTRHRYFNLAHCNCSQAKLGPAINFEYLMKLSATTGTHRPVTFWAGQMCDDATARVTMCKQIQSTRGID